MRRLRRAGDGQKGFTLLELTIAAVILVILLMTFLSTLTSSFLADNVAVTTNACRATAERLMEEVLDLSFGDTPMVDQNAVLTADGIAAKIAVLEEAPDLLLVEVYVLKPRNGIALDELAQMSMPVIRDLEPAPGSRVRLLCLKAKR